MIPHEKDPHRIPDMENFKETKYSCLKTAGVVDQVIGIAIGTAGTVTKTTFGKLKTLGLTKRDVTSLAITSIAGSASIWAGHVEGKGPS
jgi:hypothetical protein